MILYSCGDYDVRREKWGCGVYRNGPTAAELIWSSRYKSHEANVRACIAECDRRACIATYETGLRLGA